jgi:phosphoglucosamine mutase
MFGTTGIRKKFSTYDKSEGTFTPSIALRLGLALGTAVKSGTVVVGRDIRTTAIPIELALTSGLVSTGCQVLSIGMVTTPTLAMSIDYLEAQCGVMITASHNPPEYIGIKLWNKKGLGFNSEQEKEIEEIYDKRAFVSKSWDKLGSVTEIHDINAVHVKEVLKHINLNEIKRKFQVIIDPGNGSSCEIAPLLLNKLGFKYLTLNSQPDGTFPGRLSEPNSKNLQDLSGIVSFSKDVELGIALDGDADRVVFVDGYGKFIEPIRILTFLAREYIRERYPNPKSKLKIITPINSSRVIEHILEPMGVEVIRTQIGDIKVSIEMQKTDAILGGENAGTYIWKEFHMGPDPLLTMSMLLKYLSHYDKQFKDVILEIPEFPFIQNQYKLSKEKKFSLEDYMRISEKLIPALKEAGYTNIKENFIDGIYIGFDEGWILVRKSGTTPIVRISAESNTDFEATEKIQAIGNKILKETIPVKLKT